MALAATTLWEIETGGSDTANGGAFDPGQTAGMLTDGVATAANTSAPIFSSASYNFVAGDVGAWIYMASGTTGATVVPGWYKILNANDGTSGANKALVDGTIGNAVLKVLSPSTIIGCANGTSPTVITWTIDYSQQTGVAQSYTDLASAGTGLTVSSAAHPFGKQKVGNCLVITAVGTNFNLGRYVIASIGALNVATVVGPTNITTGAGVNGVGALGGALASPAMPPGVASNRVFIASGTYTITSGSSNVSGGIINDSVGKSYEGYASVRGDLGTAPIIQISGGGGVTSVTLFAKAGNVLLVRNLTLDGNNQTGILGFSETGTSTHYKLTVINCKNGGISSSTSSIWLFCSVSGCTGTAFSIGSTAGTAYFCEAFNNIGVGFNGFEYNNCLSYNNSGATSDGFQFTTSGGISSNCSAYGNGRHGFNVSGSNMRYMLVNCIAEGHTAAAAAGFTGASNFAVMFANCAAYNNNTNVIATGLTGPTIASAVAILSGSPFTNAASGDFSLNNIAGAGASCRAAGVPGAFPDGTTTGHLDIGAAQHADPAGGGSGGSFTYFGGQA